MNRYTIYCTESQTRKALRLGALIFTAPYFSQVLYEVHNFFVKDETAYYFPTAEQMIGWLDEKGVYISIVCDTDESTWANCVETKDYNLLNNVYNSRKEATLAAIDAALDYLINNK